MLQKLKIKTAILLLILVSINNWCQAQISPTSYRVGVFNEMISLPSYKIIKAPLHPGFSIGADLWEKDNSNWPQTLGANLGYYYHELYEHAFMLDAAYSFGYKFKFGLRVKMLGDLGYKHSVLSGDVYKFENGEYKKATHWGKPQFNIKAGFGIEYPIYNQYSIFADVKEMVALPYSPKQGKPFAVHLLFGAGIKYSLKK